MFFLLEVLFFFGLENSHSFFKTQPWPHLSYYQVFLDNTFRLTVSRIKLFLICIPYHHMPFSKVLIMLFWNCVCKLSAPLYAGSLKAMIPSYLFNFLFVCCFLIQVLVYWCIEIYWKVDFERLFKLYLLSHSFISCLSIEL